MTGRERPSIHFRNAPKADVESEDRNLSRWANCGLMRRSKQHHYSITSAAVTREALALPLSYPLTDSEWSDSRVKPEMPPIPHAKQPIPEDAGDPA